LPLEFEEYFSRILAELQDEVGATASVAMVRDVRNEAVRTLACNGFSKPSRAAYLRRFYRVDPWHRRFIEQKMTSGVQRLSEVFRWHHFKRTAFFRDYWRPHGFGDAIAVFNRIDPNIVFSAGFVRRAGTEHFLVDDRDALSSATPHLEQAVRSSWRLRRMFLCNQVRNPFVDKLPLAVFLVTEDLGVLECNRGAEELLAEQGPLMVKDGQLAHADRTTDEKIRRRLNDLARGAAPYEAEPRREAKGDVIASNDGSPHNIYVIPVPTDFEVVFHVVVTDLNHAADRDLLKRTLTALFGLTGAEAGVATAVFEGCRTQQIAQQRGVKPETVRGQIKSVLEKAGCSSRVELVRRISQLVVPFR
jgi:DNA-binding CsgD family transcriptional regulator